MPYGDTEDGAILYELIDGVQDLFYRTGPNGRLKFLNKAFLSIFGFDDPKDLLGKPTSSLYVIPDHRKLFEKAMQVGGGRVVNYMVYVKRSSGERFYLSVDANWTRGDPNRGVDGTGRDVTELVMFLGAFFQVSSSGVITFCSHAFAELFGYDGPEDLIGTRIQTLFPPDVGILQIFGKKRGEGIINPDIEAWHKLSGVAIDTIWVTVDATEIKQPMGDRSKVVGYQGIVKDITDVKETREEIQESKLIYELLTDQSEDGIYVIQDSKLTFVNESYCSIVGRERSKLLGTSCLDFVCDEDRPKVKDEVQRRLSGEIRDPYEIKIINGKGAERIVRTTSRPLEVGGVKSIYGFLRDVTSDRLREQELRRAVEESTQSLREALDDKELFLDTIVHEIESPAVAIRGTTDRLKAGIKGGSMILPRQFRKLEDIDELCQHIFMLHKNIAMAQASELNNNTSEQKLNLRVDILVRAWNYIKPMLRNRKLPPVNFAAYLTGVPSHIRVDLDHFLQVFFNLFSNAVKCSKSDPKLFNVEITSKWDSVKGLLLFISDMGIGIPEDETEIIFDKRVKGKLTKNHPGTGIGLWVARRVLLAYDCHIWVESCCDPTTFAVKMPARLFN